MTPAEQERLVRLTRAASLCLWKYGNKDWAEWIELRDSIAEVQTDLPDDPVVNRRVKEHLTDWGNP